MAQPAPTALFATICHPKKRAFLLAYAQTGQLAATCRAVRMPHSLHYYWRKYDPVYAQAFTEAQQLAATTLEDEAIRRARDGVRRSIFHQGKPVGEELVYSDTLLIFLLKGALPEKYGDKVRHELLLKLDRVGQLSDDDLTRLVEEAEGYLRQHGREP
jgi:hypothetical protein